MSEQMTQAVFERHINDRFHLALDGQVVDFELLEAERPGRHETPAGFREPVSLLFQGPPGLLLRQQTLTLEHPRLGALELFLVPVGERGEAYLYQSILA